VGHGLLVVAIVAALGGHWCLLRTVAWTTMQANDLAEAVQLTFDGQHPCCLCKAIAAAKKSERKAQYPAQWKRLEFLVKEEPPRLQAPTQFRLLPLIEARAESTTREPPTPPPRTLPV
jgi:hypothetical protein